MATTIHNNYGPIIQKDNMVVPNEILKLLNNLHLPNFRRIQQATHAKATPGTCLWFIGSGIFQVWKRRGKVLWGVGIPGAGKTVLASIVIHHLEQLEKEPGSLICVAYVYFRYSEPLLVRDILESLVKQIVTRHEDLGVLVEEFYQKHQREDTQPSQQDLMNMLSRFTEHGKMIFIVLDALDEFSANDRPVLLGLLITLDAKVFVTSRPLDVLQRQFPQAQTFEIAAHPSDIQLFMEDTLRQAPELMALLESSELQKHVKDTICQKSGGMFLYATLKLDTLRSCTSIHDVEESLEEVPSDIRTRYMTTWRRILSQPSRLANLAKLIFLWILHARRDMTVGELRNAVATCPDTHVHEPKRVVPENLLVSACCGLISVEQSTGLVRLVHSTVKQAILPCITESFPDPHAVPAQVCVSHLSSCKLQDAIYESREAFQDALQDDPLLAYAHHSWAWHAQRCDWDGPIQRTITEFISKCTRYPMLVSYTLDFLGPLHVAAKYGFAKVILPASRLRSPNALTPYTGRSPLVLACEEGMIACVEALLSLPAVNVNLANETGWTALMRASLEGHTEAVRLLVNSPGVDVNAANDGWLTSLICASDRGHLESVRLLLGAPAIRVNAADRKGWTALIYASDKGFTEIVRLLLQAPGININAASKEGPLIVQFMSQNAHSKPFLKTPSVDFDQAGDRKSTALICAAHQGHIETVQLLVGAPEINVNAMDREGANALMHALARGFTIVAQALLQAPTLDINAEDIFGWTALIHAIVSGCGDVLPVLLKVPRNSINKADNSGTTALMYAARQGDAEAVQLLLEHKGIDVNAVDRHGWTALLCASSGGYSEVVKLFLDAPDIDLKTINVTDHNGSTGLIRAAYAGRADVVQAFLDVPEIDLNIANDDGSTALISASRNGHVEVVKLLLNRPGIRVNMVDNHGWTAGEWASQEGYAQVVNLFRLRKFPRISLLSM